MACGPRPSARRFSRVNPVDQFIDETKKKNPTLFAEPDAKIQIYSEVLIGQLRRAFNAGFRVGLKEGAAIAEDPIGEAEKLANRLRGLANQLHRS